MGRMPVPSRTRSVFIAMVASAVSESRPAALGGPDGLVAELLGQLPQLLQVLGCQRRVVLESHSVSWHDRSSSAFFSGGSAAMVA